MVVSQYDDSVESAPLLEEWDGTFDENHFSPQCVGGIQESVQQKIAVYRRRWYILFVYSILGCIQCMIWNTWGPIERMMIVAYNWNNKNFGLLNGWTNGTFLIFVWPLCVLLVKRGLKVAMIMASVIIFLAAGIRCIPVGGDVMWFTVLANACAIINGIAGVFIWVIPPTISAIWFPSRERTAATAIASLVPQVGIAGGFLAGYILNDHQQGVNQTAIETTNATVAELQNEVMKLLYAEAAMAAAILICILIYFPVRPLFPPSISSAVNRINTSDGIKLLLRNKNVWFLAFSFSISAGVPGAWIGVMNVTLIPLGVPQHEAALLGVYSVVGGCCAVFIISRASNIVSGHFKVTILSLQIVCCASFIWLGLICLEVIPFSKLQLYMAVILGMTFNFAAYALYFECSVEVAFPVAEGLVGGFLCLFCNVVSLLFCLLFLIPNIGHVWMNYCLIASGVICMPFILLLDINYTRRQTDTLEGLVS